MAEQRVGAGHVDLTAAAEKWLTWCPAEVCGTICPMEAPPDCLSHADDRGRLVECWAAVQHQIESRQDLGGRLPDDN